MDKNLPLTIEHVRKLRNLGVKSIQEARDTVDKAKEAKRSGGMDAMLDTTAGLCQRALVNSTAFKYLNRQARDEAERHPFGGAANVYQG